MDESTKNTTKRKKVCTTVPLRKGCSQIPLMPFFHMPNRRFELERRRLNIMSLALLSKCLMELLFALEGDHDDDDDDEEEDEDVPTPPEKTNLNVSSDSTMF